MLVFACIAPHPPIILPTVGSPADRAQVKKTIEAFEDLGQKLAKVKPDCIVISSPHPDWGIQVPWYFLSSKLKIKNEKLPARLEAAASATNRARHFKIKNLQPANQLSTINYQQDAIYPILTTLDSPRQHFEWGKKIASQIPEKLRLAWIASGDMSHRLKEDGPYGLHPSGPKFDRELIERLKKKDVQGILNLNPRLVDEAGECGLRSFCMLLGALEESKVNWNPKVLSYEAPFGVGYLVANICFSPKT